MAAATDISWTSGNHVAKRPSRFERRSAVRHNYNDQIWRQVSCRNVFSLFIFLFLFILVLVKIKTKATDSASTACRTHVGTKTSVRIFSPLQGAVGGRGRWRHSRPWHLRFGVLQLITEDGAARLKLFASEFVCEISALFSFGLPAGRWDKW